MRKNLLFTLLSALLLFVSCSSDNDNRPKLYTETFYGSLLFNGISMTDDTKCEFNVIMGVAAVTIYDVQFGPTGNMGDVTISNLPCVKTDDGYVATGKNIVPIIGGEYNTDFSMSQVDVVLQGDKLTVTAATKIGTIGFSNALVKPVKPSSPSTSYAGNLSVDDFVTENVTVKVEKKEATSTLDIFIDNAKFAPAMPVQIDITLKDIPYTSDGRVEFAAADVLPFINSEAEPTAAYKFAAVSGVIENGTLNFTAQMAADLAPYVAGKVFVYEGTEVAE